MLMFSFTIFVFKVLRSQYFVVIRRKSILSMLFFHFPALVTPFPRTFIIKGNANNRRIQPSCPLFPDIAFINEEASSCTNKEATVAINEAVIGAIIAPRNPPS